jgi:hypothetical protein
VNSDCIFGCAFHLGFYIQGTISNENVIHGFVIKVLDHFGLNFVQCTPGVLCPGHILTSGLYFRSVLQPGALRLGHNYKFEMSPIRLVIKRLHHFGLHFSSVLLRLYVQGAILTSRLHFGNVLHPGLYVWGTILNSKFHP